MGRWRTQQTVRHRVNCRTHEHRHFERISQSMLLCTLINFMVLLGLHMVEGCKTMLNKLFKIFRNFKHMVYYWILWYINVHRVWMYTLLLIYIIFIILKYIWNVLNISHCNIICMRKLKIIYFFIFFFFSNQI